MIDDPREKLQAFVELPEDYTVLDLETTGFADKEGQPGIVTVGLVEVRNRHIFRSKELKVRPHREIKPHAAKVHGITNEQVANDPSFLPFSRVWPEVRMFLEGSTVVMHNKGFDWPVLMDAKARLADANDLHEVQLCCSLECSKDYAQAVGLIPRNQHRGPGLDALLAHFGKKVRHGAHGAESDALMTAEVVEALRASGQRAGDSCPPFFGGLADALPYYVAEYFGRHDRSGVPAIIHSLDGFESRALPKIKEDEGIARAWYVRPANDGRMERRFIVGRDI